MYSYHQLQCTVSTSYSVQLARATVYSTTSYSGQLPPVTVLTAAFHCPVLLSTRQPRLWSVGGPLPPLGGGHIYTTGGALFSFGGCSQILRKKLSSLIVNNMWHVGVNAQAIVL